MLTLKTSLIKGFCPFQVLATTVNDVNSKQIEEEYDSNCPGEKGDMEHHIVHGIQGKTANR